MSKFTFVSFIFWAVFLFVYVQCQDLNTAKSIAQECKTATGASDDEVEAMLSHKLADSTESKCLRACFMKKLDMMNDEGKLKLESFVKFFTAFAKSDEEKATLIEIMEECAALDVAEDHCEAISEYQLCFNNKANEKGLAMPDM